MSMKSAFRQAARRLLRAPTFALSATLTLALGIGGTVAVFTVVDSVVLRPLPYPQSDRLVDLSHTLMLSAPLHVDESDATYLLYRRDNHVFTDMGAYRATAVNMAQLSSSADGVGQPERVAAAVATPSVMRVLKVGPVRGRGLVDGDAVAGAPPVAVIGAALWHRAFGSDPAIIGRHVLIDGVNREIVGVMANGFRFPSGQTSVWVPLALDPDHTQSAAFDYRGIARLRDGATINSATADLQRLLPQVPVVFPGRLSAAAITATHMSATVRSLREVMVGDVARVLWIVLGAVALLLAVACANVAGLFLARAEGRQREFAVRRALGADRGALLGEYLTESLLLSTVGAAIGLAGAAIAVQLLRAMPFGNAIPRLDDIHVNGVVIAFTVGVAVLTATVMSLVPAGRATATSLSAVLTSDSRTATGGRARQHARRALVIVQIGLAVVLLAGAGLFARSFRKLHAVDPGFVAGHALAFRVALPAMTYATASSTVQAVDNAIAALASVPGVAAAGAVTKLPLEEEARQDSAVFVEDHPLQMGEMPDLHSILFASPGYFNAMSIPLLAGRVFAPVNPAADSTTMPREAIVSASFARRYATVTSAVGKRIRLNAGDPWITIVGVVGDVHDASLEQPPTESVYLPLLTTTITGAPYTPRDVAFVVRGTDDPLRLTPAIRSAVRTVAPDVPLYHVEALSDLLSIAAARTTVTMLLLGVAAVIATLIGATGIYGVIAYLVMLRTREMGVRLALGARPGDLQRMVVRRAVVDAVIGVVVGLVGAVLLTPLLSRLLFGVTPGDPLVLAGAAAALVVTAAIAGWLPARRAARVDPVVALRAE